MHSLWRDSLAKPKYNKLENNISTDVLVIGAGITGILTCYMLKKIGIDCILVDKNEICSGTTQNTTAKITWQHNLVYHKIAENFDLNTAKTYYDMNKTAFEKICNLSKDIDCDFELCDNFIYSCNNKSILKNEADTLNKIGAHGEYTEDISLPFDTVGAIKTKNQASIHPLKLLYRLSEGLNIYENTFIKQIKNNTAITAEGKITANKIIVATHFPFINRYGAYSMKMYQNRSYVLAVENADFPDGMYLDENDEGYSFRKYKNLLLIGGGNHRTGEGPDDLRTLKAFVMQTFPRAKIKYTWAAQDCITPDEMPYIGKYSKSKQDLLVATGFNKWGFTNSMASAMILTDIITGKDNHYMKTVIPSRPVLKSQLLTNTMHTIKDFVSLSAKRCPHLGCALKYNKQEHSWDCPCHGTRIDNNGKVLDNPANRP